MQRMMRRVFSMLGPIFPALMGRLAYYLWFTTVRFKAPPYEMDANKTASRSILDVNGKPVSVLTWGKAPFVLFIHGWTGRGTQAAPFLDGLLSAGYGVISFDAPAHGESPGKQTNMLEITDVVLALGKKYGPFNATITHSFGGMIAAYAMSLDMKFEKVISICPPADLDVIIENFSRSLRIPNISMQFMLDKLRKNFGEDLSNKISTVNNVKNLDNRALIIHDENDEDVPWQSGREIADNWKGAEFIRTQGLGHRRILRDPDVVKATIEFITESS